MALYPKAIKELIPWANANVQNRGNTKPNVLILHVAVSEARSLKGYFGNQKNASCSHFYVRRDGTEEQYIDTKYRSVADREGNIRSISVETQGGVTRPDSEPWDSPQLKALAELAAWVNAEHGIPLTMTPDSKSTTAGVSWHRRGIKGNFGVEGNKYGFVAGQTWSGFGKLCPGLAKIKQIPGIIDAAKKPAGGGSTPAQPKPTPGKSVDQMATEVIAGKHGNGHANRQKSLGISNAEYAKVRDEVNRRTIGGGSKPAPKPAPKPKTKSVSTMADEVIAGKHGTGHANRQKSLGISNAKYAEVRAEVNRKSGVPGKAQQGKSVNTMATEVIAGKHGNGHAQRQKSLGVSNSVYAQVRSEVNRRV